VWATVIDVRREELPQLSGLLDANFGGPAGLISSWKLTTDGKETVVRFEETTWGAASEATHKSLDVGWHCLIERCLKGWIETGQRCTEAAPTS